MELWRIFWLYLVILQYLAWSSHALLYCARPVTQAWNLETKGKNITGQSIIQLSKNICFWFSCRLFFRKITSLREMGNKETTSTIIIITHFFLFSAFLGFWQMFLLLCICLALSLEKSRYLAECSLNQGRRFPGLAFIRSCLKVVKAINCYH